MVHRRVADGRFKRIGKAVDDRGGEALSSRTAGEGDVMPITPAPIYEAGTLIERGGVQYTVATDLGDHVELIVPATRFPLKGGGAPHLPGGNTSPVANALNSGGFEMNNKDFSELQLRATIVPQQARWPAPNKSPASAATSCSSQRSA